GEVMVGKTSLIHRYVQNMFDDRYIMTMGTKVSKKVVEVPDVKGHDVTLEMTIWDIMGEKGFRQLLKEAYFYGAQGILAVCDLTRPSTLADLDDWIDHVLKVVGAVPVYICVNKADLVDQAKFDEDAVRAFAKAYNAPHGFTSAKTGTGVEDAFLAIGGAMAGAQLKA
ncbi:MAG TPA: Rab family GTPase, partial [Thermoplasmata archaeon]|nr:Rab family GTPase [Thermoplasmata archaeon]